MLGIVRSLVNWLERNSNAKENPIPAIKPVKKRQISSADYGLISYGDQPDYNNCCKLGSVTSSVTEMIHNLFVFRNGEFVELYEYRGVKVDKS